MLRIIDSSTVPFEDWCYRVPQTGVLITTKNYSLLYGLIVEHCRTNNISPPSEQDVIDWQCANLTVHCAEGSVPLVNRFTLGLPPVKAKGCCGGSEMKTPKENL